MIPSLDTGGGGITGGAATSGDADGQSTSPFTSGSKIFTIGGNPNTETVANKTSETLVILVPVVALIYFFVKKYK